MHAGTTLPASRLNRSTPEPVPIPKPASAATQRDAFHSLLETFAIGSGGLVTLSIARQMRRTPALRNTGLLMALGGSVSISQAVALVHSAVSERPPSLPPCLARNPD